MGSKAYCLGCCVVARWHGSGVVLVGWWCYSGGVVVVVVGYFKEERERGREREREIVKKEYLNKMVKIKIKFEMLDVL